jgi:hypothetical protein
MGARATGHDSGAAMPDWFATLLSDRHHKRIDMTGGRLRDHAGIFSLEADA